MRLSVRQGVAVVLLWDEMGRDGTGWGNMLFAVDWVARVSLSHASLEQVSEVGLAEPCFYAHTRNSRPWNPFRRRCSPEFAN